MSEGGGPHDWLAPGQHPNFTTWTCCRDCGKVKRADGKPDSPCPGRIRVETRSENSGPERPVWVDAGTPAPDPNRYVESELYVAGALSTMPPFSTLHPAWALPFARCALDALSRWEPTDG